MKKLLLLSAALIVAQASVQAFTLTLNNQTQQSMNLNFVNNNQPVQTRQLQAGASYNFPDILTINSISISNANFGDLPGGMHEPQAVLRTLQDQTKRGIEYYNVSTILASTASQEEKKRATEQLNHLSPDSLQFLRDRTMTFKQGRFNQIDIQTN